MPLQERILKRSIKIPTRSPPAARPPARPPPARRAFVLNATPSTQQHPSPTQQPVLNSIRLQHSIQYSTASRCKRESLRVLLKSRPARRPPPARPPGRRPPHRPPARRPPAVLSCPRQYPVLNSIRLQHNEQYSTAWSPTQHTAFNSMPLQERILRTSIKIPTRPYYGISAFRCYGVKALCLQGHKVCGS